MKLLRKILPIVLLFALLPLPVRGVANEEYTYYADGSYIMMFDTVLENRSGSTKQISRTAVHHNALGVEQWRVTLNTTFSYDGQTSKCDVANITINISGSGWYTVSRSASRDGDTGSCTVVMGYKLFGITTDKKTVEMSISCDKNGNIS